MIGIWDRGPDGYSPYIIICLIQPRSRSRCEKWGISRSRLIASKSLRRLDIPYALHLHVADFKETFGTGKRSDAVRSDVKFASASFIVMLLMHFSQDQICPFELKFAAAVRRCPFRCTMPYTMFGAVHSNQNSPHRRSESSLNLKSGCFMNGT